MKDPFNIYTIPDVSQNPISPDGSFNLTHLQAAGLQNDGNICSLLSLLLCLHRIGIKDHLIDASLSLTTNHNHILDFSSMVITKILSAFPSQNSFSVQLFIESWNRAGKAPRITPGFAEIDALAESVISSLQLKQYASRPPVLTELLGSFNCDGCGKVYNDVKIWEGQVTPTIPLLPLPPDSTDDEPVDIHTLLATHINQTFETRCYDQSCRRRIFGGRVVPRTGLFTILAVCRFDVNDPTNRKRLTRLAVPSHSMNNNRDLLGELVSVVCHRGDVNKGHFVSYHKVEDNWFLNDDSRPCSPSENPLDGRNIAKKETADLLFFINNV